MWNVQVSYGIPMCVIASFIFATLGHEKGKQWNLSKRLQDLEFADAEIPHRFLETLSC